MKRPGGSTPLYYCGVTYKKEGYWEGDGQTTVEQLIGTIRPGLWNTIKELEMTSVKSWQELANFLGVPYHLTVVSNHYVDKFGDEATLIILKGVVNPENIGA